jgi:nucleoid-associated protein YgaU
MANRYKDITILKDSTGKQYRRQVFYPDVPLSDDDTYLITTQGDRYDILAFDYYGDVELWWIIACANNATRDGLAIEPGIQIRIPADKNQVIRLYEKLNR